MAYCSLAQGLVTVNVKYLLNGAEIELGNALFTGYLLVEHKANYYLWDSVYSHALAMLASFEKQVVMSRAMWQRYFEGNLKPLMAHITIEIDKNLLNMNTMNIDKDVKRKVLLSEMGNFLLVYPVIEYDGTEINALETGLRHITDNNEIIDRDKAAEKELVAQVAAFHPYFNENTNQEFFHLPVDKVMENFWFLDFYEKCSQAGITMYGHEKLKKLKFSPVRASTSYSVSSNTDWFDIKIEAHFNGQHVSLRDLRKAIINKDNLVQLGDGKYGMLPQEWLDKISPALKYGKLKENGVELRKSQFAIIDALYDQISDAQIIKELAEKKVLLNGKAKVEKAEVRSGLKGTLRDYQQEGLNWLAFLDKMGFGGCLADDMGLGKTIQMISFMLYLKNKLKKEYAVSLVVCPTSLLFNWENELQKFAPGLKPLVHWGTDRLDDVKKSAKARCDSYHLWHLDKRHRTVQQHTLYHGGARRIAGHKNPESLRYKAVNLLKARNRFVMTGTPVENNTIELFAQMNFINPGLLGSLNFFKKEFAGHIDNSKDPAKVAELKRLVHPFLLRRRKEDVATELPEKPRYCTIAKWAPRKRRCTRHLSPILGTAYWTALKQKAWPSRASAY
ncbi:MAG: DEAD/DEAH box helicase family protein [Bacteroidales bacterium]|nr:DEAD/DEAH box helicase family protein [Bacteroidales bacterium]